MFFGYLMDNIQTSTERILDVCVLSMSVRTCGTKDFYTTNNSSCDAMTVILPFNGYYLQFHCSFTPGDWEAECGHCAFPPFIIKEPGLYIHDLILYLQYFCVSVLYFRIMCVNCTLNLDKLSRLGYMSNYWLEISMSCLGIATWNLLDVYVLELTTTEVDVHCPSF